MADDGNCQFRALAHELYGDQERHALVRERVVTHLRENADSYSFFVGDLPEWEEYLVCISHAVSLTVCLFLTLSLSVCVSHFVRCLHRGCFSHFRSHLVYFSHCVLCLTGEDVPRPVLGG